MNALTKALCVFTLLNLSRAIPVAPDTSNPITNNKQTNYLSHHALDHGELGWVLPVNHVKVGLCNPGLSGQSWIFYHNSSTQSLALREQNLCLDSNGCVRGDLAIYAPCSSGSSPDPHQVFVLQSDGKLFNPQSGMCVSPTDPQPYATLFCDSCDESYKFSYDDTLGFVYLQENPGLCLDIGSPIPSCDPHAVFCNQTYDALTRATDLAAHMTLREKATYMNSDPVGLSRLGVPPVHFGEALHGVVSGCGSAYQSSTGCPTSFPHALAMSGSFNRTLWRAVGEAVGTEARALSNQAVAGNLLWAPDINLFRDPRWGRGQEVPGEDPTVASEYVTHYSRGLQEGPDTKYLRAISTAKHFVAYDVEGNHGVDRGGFDAVVTDQDLVEYYMPAFRSAVEGAHVHSIMCSYNSINGVAACANDLFLNGVLREQWQFDGYVVSDCGAVGDPAFANYTRSIHNGNDSGVWMVYDELSKGCDITCGNINGEWLEAAVTSGTLSRDLVDRALVRYLVAMFRLGYLDDHVSYFDVNQYGPAQVDTPQHRQLVLEAAQQSMVLLKNDDSFLPLTPEAHTLALIGPHVNATDAMLSIYRGTYGYMRTPFQGISEHKGAHVIGSALGCDVQCLDTTGFAEATSLAARADVAVVFVGLFPGQMSNDSSDAREDEGWDRATLTLPNYQEDLIRAVHAVNPRTVVVLIHGGPLAIEWSKANIPSIIDAHYPGEAGGDAIASVLFGDISPAGRLTSTVYPADFVNVRPITDMNLRDNGGITYMHYQGTPLWEFGFGLSYTSFSFVPLDTSSLSSSLPISMTTSTSSMASLWASHRPASRHTRTWASSLQPEDSMEAPSYRVRVTNTGVVSSACVVLGFVSSDHPDAPANKELFDFARIENLAPGQSEDVFLSISPEVLALVNKDGGEYIAPGTYNITFGVDGAAEQTAKHASLIVTGPVIPLGKSLAQLRHEMQSRNH